MANKLGKVILLLVEGPSDGAAMELLLNNIVQEATTVSTRVEPFTVTTIDPMPGDLTSKYQQSIEQNIVTLVNNYVKKFIDNLKRSYRIKETDVVGIVHLIDTDGAYLDKKYIYDDEVSDDFRYEDDGIHAKSIPQVIDRNSRKTKAMNKLASTHRINKLPYRAYFMSCNLDHVTCGERNLDKDEKIDRADDFSDVYKDDLEGFKKFINDSALIFQGNYQQTWKSLGQGLNSINRHSNLHLFVNNPFGELGIEL